MTSEPAGSFNESYFEHTYGVTRVKPFTRHWWSVRLYAGMADWLLRRTGGRRMLEVGCGYGFILAKLQHRYETFGVDVSEHAIEQCQTVTPESRCFVGDVQEGLPAELERGSFDLVLACYVFEHLRDPPAAMHTVRSLLKDGGMLLFSVPNTESIGARWKGKDWYGRKDPTHCSLLPPDRWIELTREAGFRVERETSDGYWDLPYLRRLPKLLQAPLFLAPSAFACVMARPVLPKRFGENILVIAKKV
ncbi:MAG: class I SAM-dependent methyltransferase [Phycisphaerales bacterium]|nr:MAG: class I SAM-dependent methyltransferase [Phycisphaerales bacterium]